MNKNDIHKQAEDISTNEMDQYTANFDTTTVVDSMVDSGREMSEQLEPTDPTLKRAVPIYHSQNELSLKTIIIVSCVLFFVVGVACTIIGAAREMDSIAICAIVFMIIVAGSGVLYFYLTDKVISEIWKVFRKVIAVLATFVFVGLAVAAVA